MDDDVPDLIPIEHINSLDLLERIAVYVSQRIIKLGNRIIPAATDYLTAGAIGESMYILGFLLAPCPFTSAQFLSFKLIYPSLQGWLLLESF
jgi:hypothetical protein